MSDEQGFDCLIVGGGPAGLTAAIYLGRFHRRVLVVDKGEGRLAMVPVTRNHAGYPGGIPGAELLKRMWAQAAEFGAELRHGEVTKLEGTEDHFVAATDLGPVTARTVLLATGVVNLRPPVDEEVHAAAVAAGQLRYCPVCDAFEQTGKRIGLLGADDHAVREALFLRTYTDRLVMLTLAEAELDRTGLAELERAGVKLIRTPISGFDFSQDGVRISLADGEVVEVDTLYPALGSHTRNDLGVMLGTRLAEDECFITDDTQRTGVPGVYAAGDAVAGLDQISIAMGTGAQAAVTIHNDLRKRDGQTAKV